MRKYYDSVPVNCVLISNLLELTKGCNKKLLKFYFKNMLILYVFKQFLP